MACAITTDPLVINSGEAWVFLRPQIWGAAKRGATHLF